MRNKIAHYIEEQNLLRPGAKVIVGLSGGADSVVLFSVLQRLDYDCVAAHCNFHLRGEESERDEKFAESLATSFHIPFFVQHFDTASVAKERGISIEMAARDLRYAWFEDLRKKQNAVAIAVAHHRDDSIETLLLNLIRGTGIRGLTGIKPLTGFIVRPLLCVSKTEILQYADKEKLPFVTDSSNLQDEFIRNKIRNQVLPLLETLNPSVRDALTQTINNLHEAAKIYDAEIEKQCESVFNKENRSIDIARLKSFPSSESILFELLKDYGFGKETIFDIHRAMDSQSGKEFYSDNYRLVKDRTEFLLSPLEALPEKSEHLISIDQSFIEIPIRMEITCVENDENFPISKQKHFAYLNFDKLQFPLVLRRWQTGDKFVPFGMKSFQKLSDFFNNHKLSKPEKEKIWVLTSGKDIVWIVNYRIDNRFRITESAKKAIILKLL